MTEQLRFLHIDPATGELLPRARQVIAHTPMGRYGQPDDLIGALVWLLSDASRFVTGVVVPVDGGFSVLLDIASAAEEWRKRKRPLTWPM